MFRNRSLLLAPLGMALVCGPVSTLFVIRIACHVRQRQWALAGAWSIALGIMWGAMLLLTASIVQSKLRGP